MIDSFIQIENKEFQYNRRQSFSASLFIKGVPTNLTACFYDYNGINKSSASSISENKATINFLGNEFNLLDANIRLSWHLSKDTVYETGTVSGTIGETTVTGDSTDFVGNVFDNDFIKIGNYIYEIETVESNTELTLKTALLEAVDLLTVYEAYTNIISLDQKLNVFRSVNTKLIIRKDIVGLKPYIGKYELFMGAVEDATNTTIVDKSLKTFPLIDNIIGMNVRLVSGYGNCQESQITAYDPATDTITFDNMLKIPSAEENYIIINNFEFQIEQAIIDIDLELRQKGLKINLVDDYNFLRNIQLFRTLYYIAGNYEGEEWIARKEEFNSQYHSLLNSFSPKLDLDSDGETDCTTNTKLVKTIISRGYNSYGLRRF
jgi:hypothetical protein